MGICPARRTAREIVPRTPVRCLDPAARECNFLEVSFGYNEEEAKTEADRCLECGICSECYQCVDACLAQAINHTHVMEEKEIQVGSVILSAGCEPYDPTHLGELYLYKRNPNVMTSLEFERILSASGPTMGHLARPSDNKEPDRIAWLQCVGSRDQNKCGNGYCSSVCCMYAIKDAMIAKEHSKKELDAVIFNMDIRTFGKDYEKYYLRARDKEGVRFTRARLHTVSEDRETKDLVLGYVDEKGELVLETFDMLVLSVGLTIPESTRTAAQRLGVELDKNGFAKIDPFAPVSTSREGVYVCGALQGPKDIPSSVTEASAAAWAAGAKLAEARWEDTKILEMPPERDVTLEEPRIGVFVCNCGINIGGVVDVPAVKEYASTLPNVVFTDENLFTCSQDTQDKIKEKITQEGLNRVVVASCSPKTHEGLFMETLEACGLNKYLFEMANIRNQDSWIHSHNPDIATEKAKDLVRMAVARASNLRPLAERVIPVDKRALVIGGGVAGMTAALSLGDQGYETYLVEKKPELGGMARRLHYTIEGQSVPGLLKDLGGQVRAHPMVNVLVQTEITGFSGYKGNFKTQVQTGTRSHKSSPTGSSSWPRAPMNTSQRNTCTASMTASSPRWTSPTGCLKAG